MLDQMVLINNEHVLIAFSELVDKEASIITEACSDESTHSWCSVGSDKLEKVPASSMKGRLSSGTEHVPSTWQDY